MNRLSEHVYWMAPDARTDRPVLGAVAGKRGTLVVDGGNSEAHARLFLAAMAEDQLPAPAYVALTHWHWDHIFGASFFGAPIFASEATRRIVTWMAELDWSDAALDQRVEQGVEIAFCRDNIKAELPDRSGLVIVPPNVSFEGPVTIDLGGVTARLIPVGGDHAGDSIVVHIPEDRAVFLGDCLYPDLYHGPDNYSTAKLFPLIDTVLGLEADFYLGAHQPEPLPKAELAAYLELHKTIGRAVEICGPERAAVLAELDRDITPENREDALGILDAFLAGLSRSRL